MINNGEVPGCGGPRIPVRPPPPSIDQNPNNGKNPRPAPKRPPLKPEGDPGWKPGDVVQAVITAARILDLFNSDTYEPTQGHWADPNSAPTDERGGKNNGRSRDDGKCDGGPGRSPSGHATYLPRERYFDKFEGSEQCRATGSYGVLDISDYNKNRKAPGTNTNKKTRPPGMREIDAQGHDAANGHLIPAVLTGSGIDLRNLVAEYKETNHRYLNFGVEKEICNAIKSGNHLQLSVVPRYGRPESGIPTSIEYNYTVIETGVSKRCIIHQSPTGGTTTGDASLVLGRSKLNGPVPVQD
ncbi:DNA/RNA non-specific endonuclease [Streptomyces gamaensis]|uniref:DNA/RNA non-specific endonuclease n=1 Tax=Streptomyces gamaensis TaxID=1763542 RepID=A0ABW0YWU9_9ACTN